MRRSSRRSSRVVDDKSSGLFNLAEKERTPLSPHRTNKRRSVSSRVYKDIVDRSPDAIITIDTDGIIVYNNPAAETIFQYNTGDLIGLKINLLIGPPHDQLHDIYIKKYLEEKHTEVSKCPRRSFACRKNKEQFPIETTVFESDSKNGLFTAIIKDLTHADDVEKIKIQDLEEKNLFATNISHELRTPLNSIINMNYLQALDIEDINAFSVSTDQSYGDKLFDIKDANDTIRRNCTILQTQINDILDFSKLDAKKVVLRRKSFSLRECITVCADIHSSFAREKQLEFVHSVDPLLPDKLIGDHERLSQVIMNVLSNAIKFTDTGKITLEISGQRINKRKMKLICKIKDTGIGIAEKDHPVLFRSFTQLNDAKQRKVGGTGLGLAICKKICILMGGDIWLESSSKNGSVFTFSVELDVKKTRPVSPSVKAPVNISMVGRKILIVDDDENNLLTYSQYALEWNMMPVTASSARAAMVFIKGQMQFDVAIIDYRMPNVDGDMLMRMFSDAGCKFPVILLSSDNDAKITGSFFSIIQKPIKKHRLLHELMKTANSGGLVVPLYRCRRPSISTRALDILRESTSSQNSTENSEFRILVAEDDTDHQKVAVRLIQRLGYNKPDVVSDGIEAFKAIKNKTYNLVFIDIIMPNMGGLETVKKIRAEIPNPPILIALTAVATYGERAYYVEEAGFDNYLSKPIYAPHLKSMIDKYAIEHSQSDSDTS